MVSGYITMYGSWQFRIGLGLSVSLLNPTEMSQNLVGDAITQNPLPRAQIWVKSNKRISGLFTSSSLVVTRYPACRKGEGLCSILSQIYILCNIMIALAWKNIIRFSVAPGIDISEGTEVTLTRQRFDGATKPRSETESSHRS